MTIKIPEVLNDLTLNQWQQIVAIDENADKEFYVYRILNIVYGLKGVKIEDLKSYDIDLMTDAIRGVLEQEAKFENRFKLGDTEYGFIPNFDNITFGELVDLDEFTEREDYHKLMSILFRPIKKKQSGGRYKIEKYIDVGDLSEMPLGVALGAVGFFLTLGAQLVNDTLNSLTEEERVIAAKQGIAKNGGGIPLSIFSQMETY